jgi:hypothetical protein
MFLHIANTFFEWELENSPNTNLYEAVHSHEIYLQLQFLPLLYADPQDAILVSDPFPDPRCVTDPSNFLYTRIESWGPSQIIAKWAKAHKIPYAIPDWQSVLTVNSKAFSFENSPRLPHAALLHTESAVQQWLCSFPGKKVLKKCLGLSGAGHLLLEDGQLPSTTFLRKEFDKGRPFVAEPWVERLLDFSTQWEISPTGQIHYIGATLCHNDSKGQYQSSSVGDESQLFARHQDFLESHKQTAHALLEKMARLHFFGNVGIDAMLYRAQESIQLHPIVEINARKTMGWAALLFQRRYYPNETLIFRYATASTGLLPSSLTTKEGKQITFKRNVTIA